MKYFIFFFTLMSHFLKIGILGVDMPLELKSKFYFYL